MTLASMINLDEDALICDFVEVYQIYDYRSLPVKLAATLSAGLGQDSRIKKKMRGAKYSSEELLLAQIHDRIAGVLWTIGGYGDMEQPPSLVEVMLNGIPEKPTGEFRVYASAEEFEAAWKS